MIANTDNRITEQHMELLKSLMYLRTKQDFDEVRELLALYYEHKLNAAIDKVEEERGYTKEVYEGWLNQQRRSA